MTTSISLSRLRRIVADADAAYAASQQAMENFRNAKSAARVIETRINPQGPAGTYEPKDWNLVPKATWPAEYRKAREVLAEAEAAVERQRQVTSHAGSLKARALEFVRENHITLPADLEGKI